MATSRLRSAALLLICALVLAACGADEAEDGPDEAAEGGEGEDEAEGALEDELITMVVGTSPGGGFDAYARLVAPFLADELGADSTVQNLTGAGGLLALNTVWASEPDGTTVAMMNGSGAVGSVLGGADGIEFELDEFSYLGRIAGEPRVLAVNAEEPYESAEELIDLVEEFRFSATGPGGSTFNDAALAIELFDLQGGDIVAGFDGSEEAILAVTAGEVDAIVSTADTIIPHVEEGDHRALAVLATERLDELPDVPTLLELPFDEEQMAIAESMVTIAETGRIFAAPPGMPDDVLAEMRQALENVVASEEFEEEAAAQDRPISFLSGDETVDLIREALEAPESVRDILAEAVAAE
jgi:tripartite-type tricarboxylate transporter receptor subunit TctC